MIDWNLCPELYKGGMQRYIENHLRPGDFLYYALCNDLHRAVVRMSPLDGDVLQRLMMFFYWELPESCWGSEEKVVAWLNNRYSQ